MLISHLPISYFCCSYKNSYPQLDSTISKTRSNVLHCAVTSYKSKVDVSSTCIDKCIYPILLSLYVIYARRTIFLCIRSK